MKLFCFYMFKERTILPWLARRYIAEFSSVFPFTKYNLRFHSILFLFLIISTATTFSANADDNPTGIHPEYSNYKVIEKVELEELEYNIKNIEGIEDEFFLIMNQNVSIASKIEEKARKAPSIVTVITATEIENSGMRTLTDILITVPGFDIIKKGSFGVVKYGTRGVRETDGKVKVLVDGHSLNMPFNGSAATFFDDLSLKNVKRIEIIRGPGSALYGANAFLVVINIITYNRRDINGIKISSGFGSFDTQEYNVLFGKSLYEIDFSGFANYFNTNGLSETIKEDAISGIPFLNNFSITPGHSNDSRNKLDLNLKIAYKDLEFSAKYMNKDTEPFVGPSFTLTDDSDQRFNYAMADLKYKHDILEKLRVYPRLYYDQYDAQYLEEAMPEGFTIPLDLNGDGNIETFPDGMTGDAVLTNRRLGADIQFDYEVADSNTFTFGFNYEWERQDNVTFNANFDPLTGASTGSIQDISETANWIREVYRQIWAIYIQDKWNISDNMELTVGIRHDHYSDFEGTTNPRIGFVWNFMENADLKILYGQAFRAPSFDELYTINNPVFIGDPDLKPETIRTYEIGLGYMVTDKLSTNVNYFFNVIRDTIGLAPKTSSLEPQVYDNLNGSNVQGVEFEIKGHFGKSNYAFANYTYQDAESHGDQLPGAIKHKGNIGVNLALTRYLNANLHSFISGASARDHSDTRDDSPGYALVNLTLKAKNFFKDTWIKASMNNLLDKDYNDPSPMNTIPTDIPRPGRTFFIEVGYDF